MHRRCAARFEAPVHFRMTRKKSTVDPSLVDEKMLLLDSGTAGRSD
jgi:hypothetical protein